MRILVCALVCFSSTCCTRQQPPNPPNSLATVPIDSSAPEIVQAAQRGDIETVRQLVAQDSNVMFETDSKGNPPAKCAILDDHIDIAKFLIESGYPINPTSTGDFPLVMCCTSRYSPGSTEMLIYLLERGADPNVFYEPEGWLPLNMAVNNGMEDKVRVLVEHGADPHARDGRGQTAIQIAKTYRGLCKDPNFDFPHGELSDPDVRQESIDSWQSMVNLLQELGIED